MKLLNVFIVLVLLQNCSFDNKTGIWKNEKNFSKKEKNIFKDFVTLGTENETFKSNPVRLAGRYIKLHIGSNGLDDDWEITDLVIQGRFEGER